eukprot:Hpha_TRINITY_DN13067_c0_g2::TRINITY_DN13067_c0_g2_i1::g.68806::m.68806
MRARERGRERRQRRYNRLDDRIAGWEDEEEIREDGELVEDACCDDLTPLLALKIASMVCMAAVVLLTLQVNHSSSYTEHSYSPPPLWRRAPRQSSLLVGLPPGWEPAPVAVGLRCVEGCSIPRREDMTGRAARVEATAGSRGGQSVVEIVVWEALGVFSMWLPEVLSATNATVVPPVTLPEDFIVHDDSCVIPRALTNRHWEIEVEGCTVRFRVVVGIESLDVLRGGAADGKGDLLGYVRVSHMAAHDPGATAIRRRGVQASVQNEDVHALTLIP